MKKSLKIAVFGAGRMGTVIAWDLCRNSEVERVTLVDNSRAGLEAAAAWIGSFGLGAKLETLQQDISADSDGLGKLLRGCDAAAIAMPNRKISYLLIRAAIKNQCHCVDILEEYHRQPDRAETEGLRVRKSTGETLHRAAMKNGVIVLDGMGFEPGLTNVTAGVGIRRTDPGQPGLEVRVRVGGVPAEPFKDANPLQYMITWSFEHALREYVISTEVIRDGAIVPVDSASQFEDVTMPRPHGEGQILLQAAITPGMPSYLHTWRNSPWHLRHFDAKTLRWPLHWPLIKAFKDLDLLAPENRKKIAKVLTAKLAPKPGTYDLAVMKNTVEGLIGGKKIRQTFQLAVEGPPKGSPNDRLSGMARVTAFPAAWGAWALASGRVQNQGGIWAPEEIIFDHPAGPQHYSDLKHYLAADDRGVRILESSEEIA